MAHVPRRIEIVEGAAVEITWEDETVTELDAATLRGACMCAVCREPSGEAAMQAVLEGDAPVLIASAELVGGYAIRFVFEPDGHGTGIYPFTTLRELVDRWG
jgi:DUF971 family protein